MGESRHFAKPANSPKAPGELNQIPSLFLRANRDHLRLFFLGAAEGGEARPFPVADLPARSFMRCADGALRGAQQGRVVGTRALFTT